VKKSIKYVLVFGVKNRGKKADSVVFEKRFNMEIKGKWLLKLKKILDFVLD